MTTIKITARRLDGMGFLFGRLLNVTRRHGHRVYTVKTLRGDVVTLSAKHYTITGRD